ncbi:MAG: glycosyltransferase family 4 protein [Candidatus Paceibacterota bacterium]
MSHKILMFGWEFPPHNSGGLGVACEGIARALVRAGHNLHFVLPRSYDLLDKNISFVFADTERETLKVTPIASTLYSPYATSTSYQEAVKKGLIAPGPYGNSLMAEVMRYSYQAGAIAEETDPDIIHAHDWLSFPAAMAAKRATGKPFVAHVHATEYDRTGGNGLNQEVYDIERAGVQAADKVLAVSAFTRQTLIDHYGLDPKKAGVAHNGIESEQKPKLQPVLKNIKNRGGKIVLFLGRITIQKGPDYLMEAARRLLEIRDDTYFVVAGSGDMHDQMVERAAELGLADRVFFPGFVRGWKIDQLYQSADLFVMPSVSEPFGITPLEALMNKTPVLISKQSGVSEVLDHALTVDFWDTEKMADQMNAVLEHPALYAELSRNGNNEVHKISWDDTARSITAAYDLVAG